jgi:hypothetical protein
MNVTKIRIACTSGANRAPSGGDVTFDDGKAYEWIVQPVTGEIILFNYRRTAGRAVLASFQSPKRAAAVLAAINA